MSVKAADRTSKDTTPSERWPRTPRRVPRRLMPVFLFLGGTSALVFQVTWFRQFGLIFGSSTASSAAVMAVFMGGLGLGGAVLGRWADRIANPLRLYAALEGVVALAAAASPLLVEASRLTYVAMGGQSTLGAVGATIVRLGLCALVLGLPTFLMGGTLPAAAKAITAREDGPRRGVAVLYGMNTLGAVVGAAASTFVLLPQLGVRFTLWLACLLGLGVAACAWTLAAKLPLPASDSGTGGEEGRSCRDRAASWAKASALVDASGSAPLWFICSTAAGVGFAFFVMELVWYRMLGPILGGTTYTFGLILAVALTGIGIGAAVYPLLFRRRAPSMTALAVTCGLEAVCIAVPYALGDRLAIQAALLQQVSEGMSNWQHTPWCWLPHLLAQAGHGFAARTVGWWLIAAVTILPAAFVAGLQFPLLIALCGRGDENVGREVGLTAAWNTAGAILGCLAGGFGLLPLLTALGAWRAMVCLLALLSAAAILIAVRGRPRPELKRLLPLAPAAAAVLLLWSTGPTAVWRHSGIGAGRFRLPAEDANARQDWENAKRRQVRWEAEGVESSVALVADNGLAFFVNGKSDGDAVGDAGTQIMLGVLPALLHPAAKTGLVVGLGTGETPGWLAEAPGMERVDVVELEPAVDEMARRCAAVNHDVLHHPRVRRIYSDAREVLLTSSSRYDIIASEPSNPYRAGIANLFTREFYSASRERLEPDGLFVQWVQGYEIDGPTVCSILATLRSVFEHVEVWQSKADDMLLVCSPRPLRYSADDMRRKIGSEPYRSALACGWHLADLEGFLSRFVAGPALVQKWADAEGAAVNTDDHNRIEYGFARTVGESTGFSIEDLRSAAIAVGAGRPAVGGAGIDWDRVEGHRQLLSALNGVAPSTPADASAERKARATVLERYLAADTRGMVDAWEAAGYEPIYPTEVSLLALGYADQGNEAARTLIDRVRAFGPLEAEAIEAYLLSKQGRWADTARALERVFSAMRESPWGLKHALELQCDIAIEVLKADPSQAGRLYRVVREPFAVNAYEEERLMAALVAASCLGGREQVRTLETFEPFVPWNEEFLTYRLQVYTAAGHPARQAAERDLARFRDNIPAEQAPAFPASQESD